MNEKDVLHPKRLDLIDITLKPRQLRRGYILLILSVTRIFETIETSKPVQI